MTMERAGAQVIPEERDCQSVGHRLRRFSVGCWGHRGRHRDQTRVELDCIAATTGLGAGAADPRLTEPRLVGHLATYALNVPAATNLLACLRNASRSTLRRRACGRK